MRRALEPKHVGLGVGGAPAPLLAVVDLRFEHALSDRAGTRAKRSDGHILL